MKLPKCSVCEQQFSHKEIIKSQWRRSFKELKCSKCNTKYTVRNSFLHFLIIFSGAYITSKLLLINYFSPEVNLLIELLIFIITAIFISLITPYFVKLGTPIKD
ncbi:MAG: TIGR04104 family putative zinc finger protein [Anaerobacillus sp.]|uniref:TIGR04104 family putative zinc finger protein n=1 Tax=Anaerobacillus sp. TaxID=1872506 RepID=UPI00391ADFA6